MKYAHVTFYAPIVELRDQKHLSCKHLQRAGSEGRHNSLNSRRGNGRDYRLSEGCSCTSSLYQGTQLKQYPIVLGGTEAGCPLGF